MVGRKRAGTETGAVAPRGRGRPSKGTAGRTVFVGVKASADQIARWNEARDGSEPTEPLSTFLATAGDERADRILRKRKK